MKMFYKGVICYNNYVYHDNILLGQVNAFKFDRYSSLIPNNINQEDENTLIDYINNHLYSQLTIDNQEIIHIIKKYFKSELKINAANINVPIIYEIINDIDNNKYGKELYSGLIFPIFVSNDINTKYRLTMNILDGQRQVSIEKKTDFNISSVASLKTVIVEKGIANNNEILKYQNNFMPLFKKFKKQKFIDNITKLYNMNVYYEEIIEQKPVIIERKKPNKEISIMENIEYLLQKLFNKNTTSYNKYNEEYQSIINEKNTLSLNPLNIVTLTNLESKIEFALMDNKYNITNISEYIYNIKCEYLNNIINDNSEKTTISLIEINKIVDLFLGVKDEYSLLDQRKVLNDIAMLYILEIMENIDNITVEDLNNSYFEDYLKSIIININALINLNIITTDLQINLSQNLTCENVLNIIKGIKFNIKNKEEDIKKFMLK